LSAEYKIDPTIFCSKGRSTPFDGWKVQGRAIKTFVEGKEIQNSKFKIINGKEE
jgi:dihydroorotase